jgi:ferredoxin-NADP reductase
MPFADGEIGSQVTVVQKRELSPTVLLVRGRHERKDFTWLPGQYVELGALKAPHISHFYSIASAPDPSRPGEFELAMSRSASPLLLESVEPGQKLLLSSAQGAFVWEPLDGPTVLIGIGTGIAPLRAMLQAALSRDSFSPIALFYGARTESDLLFRDEFEARSLADGRFLFEPTLSQAGAEWRGARGRLQEHLPRWLAPLEGARAYVCGSTAMVSGVLSLLAARGIPEARIRAESHGG